MHISIISNGNKTVISLNLDASNMEYWVRVEEDKVYTIIQGNQEGWLPLFNANSRGDLITMPTCWPLDERSSLMNTDSFNVINLDINLLLRKKTPDEIKAIAGYEAVSSVPGVTFQSQLSDRSGNVLQIIPGQGIRYASEPKYSILTNFSPFGGSTERRPWMGLGRYHRAAELLENRSEGFNVLDCFEVLKQTIQTICSTVVSMVFDLAVNTVYWRENKEWDKIEKKKMAQQENDIVIIMVVVLAEVSEVKPIPCETDGTIKYIICYPACESLFASYVCNAQNLVS